jgi:predicted unusual protein kinase regulating ubiquinone biosynthesis (AarF/ABC1/UbiB family)
LNNGYNPRATLHERSSAYLLTRNFALAREYGLSYAVIGVRFYRALLVAELIVLQLDPEFDTRANIRRFFVRQGFHAIGKDREPVNFAMRLMDNRLVFRNLPEATRSLFNLADREMSSVRTSVSTVLVTLANICRVVAALGLVFLIAAVAASIAAEVDSSKSWAIESLAQFSWSLYFWLGVFGVLFFFVLGRILDRRSVTRGSYIRRSG